jgi:ArsR family transcriptional regulator
MTEPTQIDSVLSIVENPVRRKIIKRLSQEPSYPLEISKELGCGQQLVAAHLDIMERDGFVGSLKETSPVGPSRKTYFLKKSVYLSVGFGTHLYNEQVLSFDTIPNDISKDAAKFISKIKTIQSTEPTSMASISSLIAEIDTGLDNLEAEKAVLLYIRNLAMQQVSETIGKTEKTQDEKRVLHYVLDERNKNIENMAATLNLRESVIRNILQSLRKEFPEI